MHANHRNSQHAARPAHHGRDDRMSWLRYKHLAFGVGLALGSLLVCGTAAAASGVSAGESPTGGKVVGGAGSIVQNGAETIIKQQSRLLALDWQTFNVGKDATVLFKQPGVSAIALNRILDQNPSQIFGKINSNGQIFLINTHGIIFGAGAQLNVGGLVASTLDLTPDDFLKQHFNLDAHGGHAGVVNHGTIAAASGGSVSLIGGNVQNSGLIVADYGRINLDGADKAVLDFDGNGLINVQITGALQQRFDTEQSAVANKGTLKSASGTVVLQASAARDLFTDLVNNAGVIDAHGISTDGGVVRLVGSGGNAVSSGRIDASGVHGGSVQVLSDHNVGITGGRVDASGRDGGGSIRVGGGWQGGEGLQTAAATYIAPDATLTADAMQRGKGGSVVVWGDRVNNFYGSISARGGALGGDGGRVETSSHDGLNAQGRVDASAAHGKAGMWLLDPRNVDIITGGGGSLAGTAPNLYYSAATNNSTIDPTVINGALTGGTNVSVFTGTGGGQNGDITVTSAITAAGAGALYLKAAGSILLNADISGKDASNPLNVYLWANYGGAATDLAYSGLKACASCVVTLGDTANAAITTFGGAVDIRTGDASHAGGAVNIGNGTFTGTIDTSGTVAGALNVDANGITQMTTAGSSITAGAATLKGGSGAISLTNSGNDFSGTVNLAGGTTQITGNNNLTLGTLATGALTAISNSGALSLSGNGSINGVLTAQAVTSITVDGSLTGLTGVAFSGAGPTGTGSLTGTGAVTGLGSTAFTLTGSKAGTAGGIGFSGFSAADTTTVTGASGFDYATRVSEGMAFAAATSVTGSGAITNLGSTAFNLTGNQAGTAGSTGFSGFNAADTTTVTGASGFDYATRVSEGMAFAAATSVTGSGAITNLGSTAFNLTGNQAGTAGSIGFSGFNAADTTTVTGASGFDYATKVSEGMAFAAATSVTGTGAITNLGSTTFNLTGNQAGTAGSTGFSGFNAADTTTVTGASGFDIGSKIGEGMTFANATSVAGTGTTATITGSGQTYTLDSSTADKGSGNGVTWTSFGSIDDATGTVHFGTNGSLTGNVTAATLDYGSYASAVSFDLSAGNGASTGIGGNWTGVTAVIGSGNVDTIKGNNQTYALTGAGVGNNGAVNWTSFENVADSGSGTINTTGGQSYNLTGANAGTVATLLPGGFTGIGNLNDAASTIHFGTNGSLTGNVTAATLDYGSYASAVSFDLSAGNGATTGIGGSWTGVTAVIGSGNTDTIKGNNQSYALTGAGTGNNGAVNWTSFENVADSGAGTINTTGGQSYSLTGANAGTVATLLPGGFTGIGNLNDAAGTIHFGSNGSLTGNVTAATLDYGSYASAVSFDLSAGNGATTGIGGTWTGVTAVIGSGNVDTIKGNNQTYALTGAGTGNNGAVNWTSFENVADSGAGTIVASNQNWALTGNDQGTVTTLSGSFTGIGSLVDTGTGHFTMHSGADGSLSGSLDAGTGGTLDYTGYTTPVNVNLAGTGSTGIAGNLAGISTILADSNLGVSGTAAGSLTVTNTGAGRTTRLGTLAVGNGLTVNAGGAVLQGSGPLTVGGTTSILAGGNAITLGNVNNDFTGSVTVAGAGITLADKNDLNIAGLTNSGNGDVSLVAGGALFGVGAINAGTGNITLAANGGALNTAALTGGNITLTGAGGIVLGSNVTAGGALSLTSGSTISQNVGTVITAASLTGSSVGTTILEGNNAIGSLGDFTAAGFSLTSGQALTVAAGATVDGGAGTTLTTTGAGSDLTINGTVQGTTTELTSSGAIAEGNAGIIKATTLTGSSAGDTTLAGANQIGTLAQFSAVNFSLVNAAALTVQGPLVTTGNISLTTTGPGNVLSVGQTLTGGMISLASAGDLSVVRAIQGTTINLTANGNLAIDAAVNSGSGVTTLVQNGAAGTISQSSTGTITAGTLTGAAQGSVALTGANAIANLGDFTAAGFSLTNASALTVTAGSTVDGGDSTALKTGGDLTLDGNVKGTLTSLVSSGAINEGSQGTVTAGILTGSAAHGVQLTGSNAVNNLGNFKANGLALTNGQALTVMAGTTVDGGANTALTVTGSNGNLTIDGTLKGTTTTLKASGAIDEGAQGALIAGTLTGNSIGSTTLDGTNDVDNLGNFTAAGFSLTTDSGLTVVAGSTVDGGATTTLETTGAGNDLTIDGTVKGGLATLVSSGAIAEGANGLVQANSLTGSSVGDTRLTQTGIDALNAFKAKNFYLTNTKALVVGGPLTTTGNAGDISLATTGNGNALTVNQAVQGAAITLASAGDLTVANAVTGTKVGLAANGNLVIDAAVNSGAGTTTLTQTGNGTITGGANGSITAATLAGSATGTTTLGSAGQFMGNHVGVLGGFSSKAGFSLTNDGTLTLASVNGSAYTVDAGKSDLYLAVRNGDLLQNGTTWLYDGAGTWSASGHIGLANAPIYVTGTSPQVIAAIGLPPAYFYAVDYNGNLLPLTGATSVNVPTSILSSRSQGVNGHSDQYIDVGVITATYRAYGVVPPGLLLPADQRQCSPDQPSPECPDNN